MDVETLVDRHLATWSEEDADRRRAAYDEVYAADVRLVEPSGEGRGHEAVEAAISGLQGGVPGGVLAVDGQVGHHHDAVNYRWTLALPNGQLAARGSDVLLLEGERIATAYVFIDAPG